MPLADTMPTLEEICHYSGKVASCRRVDVQKSSVVRLIDSFGQVIGEGIPEPCSKEYVQKGVNLGSHCTQNDCFDSLFDFGEEQNRDEIQKSIPSEPDDENRVLDGLISPVLKFHNRE